MPKPTLRALLFAAVLAAPAAASAETYVRAGVGYDWSSGARFADADCAQTAPPALFGCAAGLDGRPLGAAGHFGKAATVDLGLGYRLTPWARVEAQGTWRPELDFTGDANFLRTPGEQPVDAEHDSLSALAVAYFDLPPVAGARPFVSAGAGLARNRLGAVVYGFPGLAPNATTVTAAGRSTGFAWSLGAGAAWPLSGRMTLDLAYRYTDLGEVRTAAGPIVITRTSGVRSIDVAPTRARLETHGLTASVRFAF